MIYKNRNDGYLETLLNTEKSAINQKEEKYNLMTMKKLRNSRFVFL